MPAPEPNLQGEYQTSPNRAGVTDSHLKIWDKYLEQTDRHTVVYRVALQLIIVG